MASGNGNHDPSGLSPQAEVAARAFVQLLARELSAPAASTSSHMGRNQPPVRAVSTPVRAGDSAQPVPNNDRVRQAMRRQFPNFNMYVLSGPSQFTPKGSEELEHAHAGLGKRILSIPDNLIHSEIVALLEGEFPKLKTLKGGWMFYKATGGSGRRKLSIIPTESEGYSTRLLKSASNNGKNTMFISWLFQELLSHAAVIQNIHWPEPKSDSDEEEDDPVPLERVSLITGFLRKFIEEASPEVLRDLMRLYQS
ncbi:unnamed protein product [Boreogadus saida]